MMRSFVGILAILMVMLWRVPDAGATVLYTGTSSSNDGLSAQASFSISGTTLTILLTNTDAATGSGRPDHYDEVLSGLFFNLGTSAFTPNSATIQPGGSIIQTSNCNVTPCGAGTTNVGGEWSYAYGGASWITGDNQGISSAEYLGSAASSGNMDGVTSGPGNAPNYQSPTDLSGLSFALVPDGFVANSGDSYMDTQALIEGTVKFVLTVPAGLTESAISNVYFTYGKYSTDGKVKGYKATTTGTTITTTTTGSSVPEPASLALLGLGLIVAGSRLRRRRT